MAHQTQQHVLDSTQRLKDSGIVTADAAGLVGGVAARVDLGSATAFSEFDVVIDWTALDIPNNDELYDIRIEGATTTNFAQPYILAQRTLGALSSKGGLTDTPPVGRVVIRGDNTFFASSTDGAAVGVARYIRVFCAVAGTAPSINYTAWFLPRQ